MKFIKFFHKIFRPNCFCKICSEPVCPLCDQLQILLQQERADKSALLKAIIDLNRPVVVEQGRTDDEEQKPVHMGSRRNLSMLRNTLEQADRLRAEEANKAKDILKEMNQVKPRTEEELIKAAEELNNETRNQ